MNRASLSLSTFAVCLLISGCRANVDLAVGRAYPCDPALENQCAGGWRCSPERVCFDPSATGKPRRCTSDTHCNTGWTCGTAGTCVDGQEQYALAFQAQPVPPTAGNAIAPPLKVAVKNARGEVVTGLEFDVTLTLATNPTGATLTGGGPIRTVAGVATFPGATIDRAGAGYVLSASATDITGASTMPFSVNTRSFTKLTYVVQPANTVAGMNFASVQVALQDDLGNTVTGNSANVQLTLTGGASGATLRGTTTVTTTNGIASFGGLSIQEAGTGYRLTAAAPGAPDVQSASFDISAGPPGRLRIVTQPMDTAAGQPIQPSPQVAIDDAFGNPTSSTATVVVSLATGTLHGTSSRAAVAGVATFDDLSINAYGGYPLLFNSAGCAQVVSTPFVIRPGPAAALAYLFQPMDVTQGTVMSEVNVRLVDAFGNVVGTGTPSISLSLVSPPSGVTLGGTTTLTATAGSASFTNLRIDQYATGLTLRATSTGLTPVTSPTFDVDRLAVTTVSFGRAAIGADAGVTWRVEGTPETLTLVLPDAGATDVLAASSAIVKPFPTSPGPLNAKFTTKVRATTAGVTNERSETALVTSFGGPGREEITGLAVDENGGTLMAGTFNGSTVWGPDGGTQIGLTSAGGNDLMIGRTDETGELGWLVRAGGTGTETCGGAVLLRDGSAAVVGSYSGSAVFGQGQPNQTTLTTAGAGMELYVARYNTSGLLEWAKKVSSTNTGSGTDAFGVAATPDGALVVVGNFARQATFGLGELNPTVLCAENNCSSGLTDVFVARYELDGTLAWAKRAGGSGTDGARAVAIDASGEIYVTGYHSDNAVFGAGETAQTTLTGGNSGFVAHYSPAGRLRWAKNLSSSSFAIGETISVGAQGSVAVGGRFQVGLTLGAGEPNATALTANASDEGWLARFKTTDGTLSWAKAISTPGGDSVASVVVLDDGSIAASGRFQGTLTLGSRTLPLQNTINSFLARFSPSGVLEDVDRTSSAVGDAEDIHVLAAMPEGTVFFAGNFLGTATFDSGEPSAKQVRSTGGSFDALVGQWQPSTWRLGQIQPTGLGWASVADGATSERGAKVATLPDGRQVAVGNYGSLVAFTGGLTLPPSTGVNVFIASYAPNGTVEWVRQLPGNGTETVYGVVGHLDGSVTVLGSFNGTLSFTTANYTSGQDDVYLARYDATGTVIWAKRAGSAGTEEGYGLAALPGGNVLVTGTFDGSITLGSGEPGVTTLNTAGDFDVFVAQYGDDGRLRWAKRAGGAGDDQGFAIAGLPNGGAIATGYMTGTAIFGQGEANQTTLTGSGGNDLFVAKYGPTGLLTWAKRAGGNAALQGNAVGLAADGTAWVIVNGVSVTSATFGPGEAMPVTFMSSGVMAAHYASDGHLLSVRGYSGWTGESVAVFDDGALIFSGQFQNAFQNLLPPNTTIQTYFNSAGMMDGYAVRLVGAGQVGVWRFRMGGSGGNDSINGLATFADGSLAMTGEFHTMATLDPGQPNAATLTATNVGAFVGKWWNVTP